MAISQLLPQNKFIQFLLLLSLVHLSRVPMKSSTDQIKKDLISKGADPFQIAAEAIERGDRLLAHIQRLESSIQKTSIMN